MRSMILSMLALTFVLHVAQGNSELRWKRQLTVTCTNGQRAVSACINSRCGQNYVCDTTRNYCCAQVLTQMPLCPDNVNRAVAGCLSSRCSAGYSCVSTSAFANMCCTSNTYVCPNGATANGPCTGTGRGTCVSPTNSYQCINNVCCFTGTATGTCPTGQTDTGVSCATTGTCATGQCTNTRCCVTATATCPGNATPTGACLNGACASPLICVSNSICCNAPTTCSNGAAPIGTCLQPGNICGTGTCEFNSICC